MLRFEKYITLVKNNTATGVDIHILPDGSKRYHLAVLKKNKLSVDIVTGKEAVSTIEELKNNIPLNTPVLISINGKGLIHKKGEINIDGNDSFYLNQVLPDTSPADFYIQKTLGDGNSIFISVARKTQVEEILKEFIENGIDVISCSLGPFPIQTILNSLNDESVFYDLVFSCHKFTISKNQFTEYVALKNNESNTENIQVGNQPVEQQLLIPFALSIGYFINERNAVKINSTLLEEAAKEYKQKRIFKVAAPAISCFFILLFLITFFIKQSLESKKENLENTLFTNQPQLDTYNQLLTAYKDKQLFLEKSGLLQASKASFYIDKLAMDAPDKIQFNELNFYPAKRKAGDDTTVTYKDKTILISGMCNHSSTLNEWIKVLEKKNFVKQVTLDDYVQEKTSRQGEFTVQIKMN